MNNGEMEERLLRVLSRTEGIEPLPFLISALKPDKATHNLAQTAIGIDSSVFLRLGNNNRNADLIDYLSSKHTAPLILPGQAIQEFWNNQLSVVDTLAANLKKEIQRV